MGENLPRVGTGIRNPGDPSSASGDVLDHLAHQATIVDSLLVNRPSEAWTRPTPAAGWTVTHHVAHLLWTDDNARNSLLGRHAFAAIAEKWRSDVHADPDIQFTASDGLDPTELLTRWRSNRAELVSILRRASPGPGTDGPALPVDPAGLASVLVMETWAHGHDIADALGMPYPATEALRHIADLGVRTRGFSYANRGLEAPAAKIRIELDGPDGQRWNWGPERGYTDSITGTAEDFCFAVTQRKHLYELDLAVTGPNAIEWLRIAQAFSGEATTTPRRSQRPCTVPSTPLQSTKP